MDKNNNKKVLLIDDDADFVKMHEEYLLRNGYTVDVAYNGKDGLHQVVMRKPDIIVLDMMMETWSEGTTVVNQLRRSKETRSIPIIFVSAVNMRSSINDIQETEDFLHVDRYLTKPFLPETLAAHIQEVLAGKSE